MDKRGAHDPGKQGRFPSFADSFVRFAGNIHAQNLNHLHEYDQQHDRHKQDIRLIPVVAIADGNLPQSGV